MIEKVNTGGLKTFKYTKEDITRIRNEDTESTKEFKIALKNWQSKNRKIKLMKKGIIIFIILIGLILLYLRLII